MLSRHSSERQYLSSARSSHFLALFAASLYLALLGASGSVLAQDQGEQPQNPAPGNESSKRFDRPPILLSGKAPAFPLELQVKGSFETVTIQFTIDEEGKTKDFKVLDATKPFA